MLNHPTGLFWETIIRPFGGAGPSNFYTPYNSLKCISSRVWGAGRPHVGLCPIFLVSIYKTNTADIVYALHCVSVCRNAAAAVWSVGHRAPPVPRRRVFLRSTWPTTSVVSRSSTAVRRPHGVTSLWRHHTSSRTCNINTVFVIIEMNDRTRQQRQHSRHVRLFINQSINQSKHFRWPK